jgi:uncharacterized protein (DUF302 family)
MPFTKTLTLAATIAATLMIAAPGATYAQPAFPFADARVERTSHRFPELVQRLERAIEANRMGLVARASASAGAAARNVTIPGNAVLMVFRNDFAVRMLNANLAAGIEAPIRFYVTENADGTATLSWRPPTAVFAPYRSADLDALARELDPIFAKIAEDAIGR